MCASSKLLLEIQRWKMMVNCTQRVGKDVHEPRQQKKEEYCLDVGIGRGFGMAAPIPVHIAISWCVPTKKDGLTSQNAAGLRNIGDLLSSLPVLKL